MAPPLEDPSARGEFSLVGVSAFKLTACQETEQWETCDEEGIERADEVVLIITLGASFDLNFSKWRTRKQRMLALLPLLTATFVPKWILISLIFGTDLTQSQVDAEIKAAGENDMEQDSKEAETKV